MDERVALMLNGEEVSIQNALAGFDLGELIF